MEIMSKNIERKNKEGIRQQIKKTREALLLFNYVALSRKIIKADRHQQLKTNKHSKWGNFL